MDARNKCGHDNAFSRRLFHPRDRQSALATCEGMERREALYRFTPRRGHGLRSPCSPPSAPSRRFSGRRLAFPADPGPRFRARGNVPCAVTAGSQRTARSGRRAGLRGPPSARSTLLRARRVAASRPVSRTSPEDALAGQDVRIVRYARRVDAKFHANVNKFRAARRPGFAAPIGRDKVRHADSGRCLRRPRKSAE